MFFCIIISYGGCVFYIHFESVFPVMSRLKTEESRVKVFYCKHLCLKKDCISMSWNIKGKSLPSPDTHLQFAAIRSLQTRLVYYSKQKTQICCDFQWLIQPGCLRRPSNIIPSTDISHSLSDKNRYLQIEYLNAQHISGCNVSVLLCSVSEIVLYANVAVQIVFLGTINRNGE